MMATGTYGLVTPAKNEAKNLPTLVQSVCSQSTPPFCWVFLNDGSSDGTSEVIESLRPQIEAKVQHFVVVNYLDPDSEYALGPKYSRIVSAGWATLAGLEREHQFRLDFQGILDADSFPTEDYFATLLREFMNNPRAGILSGEIFYRVGERVEVPPQNRDWALGMCRIWRRDCFDEAGYLVSISADAVSAARAVALGWAVYSLAGVLVETRELGAKFGQEYYGRSAYVRHLPLSYVLLGVARILLAQGLAKASLYWRGYRNAAKAKEPRLSDTLALSYFRHPYLWKLRAYFKGFR